MVGGRVAVGSGGALVVGGATVGEATSVGKGTGVEVGGAAVGSAVGGIGESVGEMVAGAGAAWHPPTSTLITIHVDNTTARGEAIGMSLFGINPTLLDFPEKGIRAILARITPGKAICTTRPGG
jgi:hypothetical protein